MYTAENASSAPACVSVCKQLVFIYIIHSDFLPETFIEKSVAVSVLAQNQQRPKYGVVQCSGNRIISRISIVCQLIV